MLQNPELRMKIENDRMRVLYGIMARGGLFGSVAEMHIYDEENGNGFIRECFLQCHNPGLFDFWGVELVMEIVTYMLKYVRALYEECALLQGQLRGVTLHS
jgi:hypothetical protein